MSSAAYAASLPKARLSTGLVVSAIPVLFLLFDTVIKLLVLDPAHDTRLAALRGTESGCLMNGGLAP